MEKQQSFVDKIHLKVFVFRWVLREKWQTIRPVISTVANSVVTLLLWIYFYVSHVLKVCIAWFRRAPQAPINTCRRQRPPTAADDDDKMGVSTVLKDYGTDILDAIRENNLLRLQAILDKQLKSDAKIARVCVTDIKHRPSKKFACPLILAARQEDPQILQWMMHKGVDPNFVHHTIYSSKRREIVTALHIAVDLAFYDTVEVLLGANADCNICDHKQETPLLIAVKKADRVMCQMLLSKGADPTIVDSLGNAALHVATLYGHLLLVKLLLRYDADIYQKGADGAIAPHIAAKEGHIHLMHLFCSRHLGNVNIQIPCYADQREKAPLHMAAENAHKEIVHILLDQYDADVNVRDSDHNTALHCCVLNPYDPHRMRERMDFYDTAKILLKGRVGVNAKNAFGDTALHLASMNRFQRIVELLLEVGANPFIENDEKLKAIDVVPDDDPVTRQVLKTAMLQGPPRGGDNRINLSVETLNRDMSGSFMNWTKPLVSKVSSKHAPAADVQSSNSGSRTTDSNSTRDQTSERVNVDLDRSLSVSDSQRTSVATLPSVFEDQAAGAGRHRDNAQLPPSGQQQSKKDKKSSKNQNLEQTRAVDGADQGEGQTKQSRKKEGEGSRREGDSKRKDVEGNRKENEGSKKRADQTGSRGDRIQGRRELAAANEYTNTVEMRQKKAPGKKDAGSRDGKTAADQRQRGDSHEYSNFSSVSQLSSCDGSTQTLQSTSSSRDRGVQVSRGHRERKSRDRQEQVSFDDTESMDQSVSRVSDVYSVTSEYTEYSEYSEQPHTSTSRAQRRRAHPEEYEDDRVSSRLVIR